MPREARPHYLESRKQWYAAIGEPNAAGESRRVYFPKRVADEPAAWRYMHDLLERRRAQVVDLADPTFGDLVTIYRAWLEAEAAEGRIGEGTVVSRRSLLKIAAACGLRSGVELGTVPLRRYTVEHHHDLVTSMIGEGYSVHYCGDINRAVQAMLNWAARPIPGRKPAKILETNPVAGYRMPEAPPREDRYQPQPEIRRFLRWAWSYARRRETGAESRLGNPIRRNERDRRFDRVFVLMLHTMRLAGARPKELRLATWEDVDWEALTITLDPKRHKTGRKTGRERTIYLTPPVARILRHLHARPDRHPTFVFAHALGPKGYLGGHLPETGQPWESTSSISKKLREWRKVAAEMVDTEGRPAVPAAVVEGASRLVPYLNRHAYITDALLEGAATVDVAKMVGNSPQVLEHVYDHAVKARLAERAAEIAAKRRASGRRKP